MKRIIIAGFLHETNTFARSVADWANFENGEGFPRMHRGGEVLELRKVNVPIGGFISAANDDWSLLPVIWCAASPSGPVTNTAYERIVRLITDACEESRPDGVYLDLHGAMVTEKYNDGDGELIRRVRAVVGPNVPIVVSLDLHANISDGMLNHADAMVAYRTYPHIDMADTGIAAARLLGRCLAGERLVMARERIDFLIPTISGSTMSTPARDIFSALCVSEGESVLSVAMAFPATDVPDCQPCVFGYGSDETLLKARIHELAETIRNLEADFALRALPTAEALDAAEAAVAAGRAPVVIADTQDNPGAGGDGNTNGLLAELLLRDVPKSAVCSIFDPHVVATAIEAGENETVTIKLKGSQIEGDPEIEGIFTVERITAGFVSFEGPMMNGNELSVGPSVLLRKGNIRIIVNSHKAQTMDRNQFRAPGVEPETQNILVVKSSVHFRGDFEDIAGQVIVALSPGPFPADPAKLPWKNLKNGVRLGPNGPAFASSTGAGRNQKP